MAKEFTMRNDDVGENRIYRNHSFNDVFFNSYLLIQNQNDSSPINE